MKGRNERNTKTQETGTEDRESRLDSRKEMSRSALLLRQSLSLSLSFHLEPSSAREGMCGASDRRRDARTSEGERGKARNEGLKQEALFAGERGRERARSEARVTNRTNHYSWKERRREKRFQSCCGCCCCCCREAEARQQSTSSKQARRHQQESSGGRGGQERERERNRGDERRGRIASTRRDSMSFPPAKPASTSHVDETSAHCFPSFSQHQTSDKRRIRRSSSARRRRRRRRRNEGRKETASE